jgi:hypothetical protein
VQDYHMIKLSNIENHAIVLLLPKVQRRTVFVGRVTTM